MSRLVANAQLKAEEMLCGFHQNGIVLIISPLNALMDDQIEEAERLNMHAANPTRGGGVFSTSLCKI